MNGSNRFHAFIVRRRASSHFRVRRITLHKHLLGAFTLVALIVSGVAAYGLYALVQQPRSARLADENRRLRVENERRQKQLDTLEDRLDAIEDVSRRLARMSGVEQVPASAMQTEDATNQAAQFERGKGGPVLSFTETDALKRFDHDETFFAIEARANNLRQALLGYESILSQRLRVPSIFPVEGYVSDGYGMRGNPFDPTAAPEFHAGQDIAAPQGTSVCAAGSGIVTFAGVQNGYGNVVIIDHGDGLQTRYGHLSEINVVADNSVMRGEQVGRVGSTGRSTGAHLHYEVRVGDRPVNPRRYLPRRES